MSTFVAYANYGKNTIHIAQSGQPAYELAPQYDIHCYADEFVDAVSACVVQLEAYMQDIPYSPDTLSVPRNHDDRIPGPPL